MIIDIDRSNAMDFSETIEVKVMDRDEHFAMDSYFFAYFQNISEALEQIGDVVSSHRVSDNSAAEAVSDTTVHRTPSRGSQLHAARSSAANESQVISNPPSSAGGFKLTSLLRPFSEAPSLVRQTSGPADVSESTGDYTHVLHASSEPATTSLSSQGTRSLALSPPLSDSASPSSSDGEVRSSVLTASGHTYPPGTHPLHPTTEVTVLERQPGSQRGSWTGVVPSWFRSPSLRLFALSNAPSVSPKAGIDEVKEVLDQPTVRPSDSDEGHSSSVEAGNQLGFSILDAPDYEVADASVVEKFRKQFALDEKETLVGCELY